MLFSPTVENVFLLIRPILEDVYLENRDLFCPVILIFFATVE